MGSMLQSNRGGSSSQGWQLALAVRVTAAGSRTGPLRSLLRPREPAGLVLGRRC